MLLSMENSQDNTKEEKIPAKTEILETAKKRTTRHTITTTISSDAKSSPKDIKAYTDDDINFFYFTHIRNMK